MPSRHLWAQPMMLESYAKHLLIHIWAFYKEILLAAHFKRIWPQARGTKVPRDITSIKMLIFGDISRFKRIKFACLNFNLAHLGPKLTHLSLNLNSYSLILAHVILKPISFTPKNAPLLLLKPFQVSLRPCQLSSKPFSLPLRLIELPICNKHHPLISFLWT